MEQTEGFFISLAANEERRMPRDASLAVDGN